MLKDPGQYLWNMAIVLSPELFTIRLFYNGFYIDNKDKISHESLDHSLKAEMCS